MVPRNMRRVLLLVGRSRSLCLCGEAWRRVFDLLRLRLGWRDGEKFKAKLLIMVVVNCDTSSRSSRSSVDGSGCCVGMVLRWRGLGL